MNEMINRLNATRQQAVINRSNILTNAEREGRANLNGNEDRRFQQLTRDINALDERIAELKAQQQATEKCDAAARAAGAYMGAVGGGSAEYRDGRPLTDGQDFRGFARAHGVTEEDNGLSLQKVLRGVALGEWHGADREARAMTGSTSTAGGYMIPTLLSSEIVDLARNQAAVLKAGARVFPMANRTVDVAKWATDPTVAWRAEGATIPASDAVLAKLTLSAKSLSGLCVLSRELLEDAAEVDSQLKRAFAEQVALAIDSAALYGSGASNTPTGVKSTSGIQTAAFGGANGATLSSTTGWNVIADAKGTLADQNETATAAIYAPRTDRQLGKLVDTTGQPLEAPEYVADVARYATNQVPVALTVGTSTDCSDVFVADWSQLYVGIRTSLLISVLTERYADTGQVGILVWTRADIAVARAKAFSVTSGLRA